MKLRQATVMTFAVAFSIVSVLHGDRSEGHRQRDRVLNVH